MFANRTINVLLSLLYCITIVSVVLILNTAKTPEDRNINEILLDNRSAPSWQEIIAKISQELPSLPINFLYGENDGKDFRLNENCAPIANLSEINFNNQYYQTFYNDKATLQLFGAYFDNRSGVVDQPTVRIAAMIRKNEAIIRSTFCQLWYNDSTSPDIVEVTGFDIVWNKKWQIYDDLWHLYILSCRLPSRTTTTRALVPEAVSLVRDPCDWASNILKVVYEKLPPGQVKEGFAVCVKNLFFPFVDMSARLVEWLELMRLLGAKKVIIYELSLHPNITKVFNYYQSTGFVEMRHMTFAGGDPPFSNFMQLNILTYRANAVLNELTSYNDCLYRNMYKYQYLVVMDTDEVIMPLGNFTNWQQIVDFDEANSPPKRKCKSRVSYCFRNVYFPKYEGKLTEPYASEAPHHLYMLQHVQRVRKHLDYSLAPKCFHNTDYVIGQHNHYPIKIAPNGCPYKIVSIHHGQMQHYREPDIKATLNDPVVDANIWRFKDTLVQRSTNILRELGFYGHR